MVLMVCCTQCHSTVQRKYRKYRQQASVKVLSTRAARKRMVNAVQLLLTHSDVQATAVELLLGVAVTLSSSSNSSSPLVTVAVERCTDSGTNSRQ
jgi:hypothetical protein